MQTPVVGLSMSVPSNVAKSSGVMGRPKKSIDHHQLKALMRLKPSLKDTAAFFKCSQELISTIIDREFGMTFPDFRDQYAVASRFSLIRKALAEAENGNNQMLIFCLKNMCGWTDKHELSAKPVERIELAYNLEDETEAPIEPKDITPWPKPEDN